VYCRGGRNWFVYSEVKGFGRSLLPTGIREVLFPLLLYVFREEIYCFLLYLLLLHHVLLQHIQTCETESDLSYNLRG
jgi:hypothetical protein